MFVASRTRPGVVQRTDRAEAEAEDVEAVG
jgi:hypothetical protein